MSARMTAQQMESLERQWKAILFCFALMLMLDLVYLGVLGPTGTAKVACLVIAAALVFACVYAVRALHRAGYKEEKSLATDGDLHFPFPGPFDIDD